MSHQIMVAPTVSMVAALADGDFGLLDIKFWSSRLWLGHRIIDLEIPQDQSCLGFLR